MPQLRSEEGAASQFGPHSNGLDLRLLPETNNHKEEEFSMRLTATTLGNEHVCVCSAYVRLQQHILGDHAGRRDAGATRHVTARERMKKNRLL